MQLYPLLTQNKTSTGAILPNRIVAGTATDGAVAQSAAAGNKHIGVSTSVGVDGANQRIDVHLAGVVPLVYGGNVAFGDALTSDASGRGIVATVGSRIIGIAAEAGVLDTIGSVQISPGFGPAA